jgi:Family of unknown function (DUF6541)
MALLSCTAFYCVIALPGVGLVALVDRDSRWSKAIAVGGTASFAAAIVCGYYLLRAGMPFVGFLAAEYLALGASLTLRSKGSWKRSQPAAVAGEGSGARLPILLALVFASRSVPLFFGEVPQGIDPSFHVLIARKILLSGTIPTDWLPFEAVKLNYPVGSHVLIAETARLTGIPVHVVFGGLFPFLACLTTVSLYCLAVRLLGDREAAWYAAICYSFVAVWGSLDYYRWGGLPNLLGMLFLLGLVEATFARRWRFSVPLFAFLFAALIVTHHHSALCAAILFAGYASFAGWLDRPLARTPRRISAGLACAALLALVPIMTYLRAGEEVGQTSVLKFYEPLIPLWNAVADLGVPLVILGVAGTVVLCRADKRQEILFLTFWIAALFGVFSALEYAYRFGVYLFEGEFYTALTPSRFLTDLAYPLSIAAGYSLAKFTRDLERPVASAVVLCAALAWSYFPIRAQCSEADPGTDVAAYSWIAAHAEENAFVVSSSTWAPYFTWREGAYTPLPASEARNEDWVRHKRRVLLRDLAALLDFNRTSKRPVYVALPVESPSLGALEEVYRGEKTKIYKIPG